MGTVFAHLERTSDSSHVTHTTAAPPCPRLIAVDWGTSSLRVWLMDGAANVLSARRRAKGLLSIADLTVAERGGEYERILSDVCGDWLRDHPGLPAIACGMVGSSEGWVDAGYLALPTDLTLRADAFTTIDHAHGVLHVVPGLRIASLADAAGDLLRGEESQLVGALDLAGRDHPRQTFVLPGTHTKWVRVEDGKVISFTTAMTGEIFGLLLRDGLLARTAAPASGDDRAFERGLRTTTDRGLLTELFGGRALVLDGLLDPSSLPDYISGVLIADELRHQLPTYATSGPVVLCGAPELCARYSKALAQNGVESRVVPEDATARGLWTIAHRTGLIDPTTTDARGGNHP
jgi:2-dehydro-3-deoxygalactonokinase